MRWMGLIAIGIVFVIGFVTTAVRSESAGEGDLGRATLRTE
jgi:hypothetical protein